VYIKRKHNRSGTTSIVVVDKSSGKYKELVSIGTSSNPAELEKFNRTAQQWINDRTGTKELDFAGYHLQTEKFLDQIEQILINGTELLLTNIFNQIGFSKIEDEVFRHLVLSRLSFPGSKRATVEYLKDYYDVDINLTKIYRYLDKVYDHYKYDIQQISVAHTRAILGGVIGIVFYDVTTLYFETSNNDELRITGFSKDGKHQNPQIVLGLLVSTGGYPLAYQIFEGNKFEGHTMLPIINGFAKEYDIENTIVVADAGLMTSSNISDLEDNNYQYIIGAKIKNETKKVKKWILSQDIHSGEFAELKKADGKRLVLGYSEKRAKKDFTNRKKGLKRLEKLYQAGKLTKSSINKRGYNKYLKMDGQISVDIDYELFNRDGRWDGLKGYLTNTKLSAKQVHANYSNLWKIENAFRITKNKLEVRPIFHFTPKRIEAHVCICFAAYKVYKELERLLKLLGSDLSPDAAIRIAKTICTIKVQIPNSSDSIEKVLLLTEKQKKLGELFNF
jgi:transposase